MFTARVSPNERTDWIACSPPPALTYRSTCVDDYWFRVVPVMISTRDHDQSVSSNADVGDGGLCAAPDLDRESSNTPCWTVGVKATSYSASSLCLIATEPRVGHRTGDQHPAVHFLATGGEVPASSLSC